MADEMMSKLQLAGPGTSSVSGAAGTAATTVTPPPAVAEGLSQTGMGRYGHISGTPVQGCRRGVAQQQVLSLVG